MLQIKSSRELELHFHDFQQRMGLNLETESWTTTPCLLMTSPPAPDSLEEPERFEMKGLKSSFHTEMNSFSIEVHYNIHKRELLHRFPTLRLPTILSQCLKFHGDNLVLWFCTSFRSVII